MTKLDVEKLARRLAKENNIGFNNGYMMAIRGWLSGVEPLCEVTDDGWENYMKEAENLLSNKNQPLIRYSE